MMWLLDWRSLTLEQWHTILHSPQILNTVRGGMMSTLGCCIKLVLRFGQLTYIVYIVQILWSQISVSKSEFNISKAFTNQQNN